MLVLFSSRSTRVVLHAGAAAVTAAFFLMGRAASGEAPTSPTLLQAERASGQREPLRDVAARSGLLVGAAVNPKLLDRDPDYRETLARHFSSVTPENVMKWEPIHPEPDCYNFAPADRVVDFATSHGMAVHGHALVWYRQMPDWIKTREMSREEAIGLMRDHIRAVVGRYRGRLASWDVVNEAIDDECKMRSIVWLDRIGPDYIDLAFRFAHEADPEARLYYNDYGAEGGGPKADAVFELVKGLKERGVPVHGIGFQMHVGTANPPSPDAFRRTVRRFTELGLIPEVTEMDVALNEGKDPGPDLLQRQAQVYSGLTKAAVDAPGARRISFWGVDDGHSWIQKVKDKPGAPLLFDAAYQPKPALDAVRQVLERRAEERGGKSGN